MKRDWEVSRKEGAQAYVAQGRSSGGVESLKHEELGDFPDTPSKTSF